MQNVNFINNGDNDFEIFCEQFEGADLTLEEALAAYDEHRAEQRMEEAFGYDDAPFEDDIWF